MPKQSKLFLPAELGVLRYKAAYYIRLMIRSRATQDPTFLTPEYYEVWELDGLGRGENTASALRKALWTIREVNDRFLERCGSGGMRLDDSDPLFELKELVGFFADYQNDLPSAIQRALDGRPIDWANLAQWNTLPAIRRELDKLPQPDGHSDRPRDGPDPDGRVIRWEGRSARVGAVVIWLAEYLWDSQSTDLNDAIDAVWTEDSGERLLGNRQRHKLSSTLNRLNDALTSCKVPWTYSIQGNFIYKNPNQGR